MGERRRQAIVLSILGTIILFFVINRIVFSASTMLEAWSSYVLAPVLSWQHSLVETWKARVQERTSAHTLNQELTNVRQELEDTRARTITLQAELLTFKEIAPLVNVNSGNTGSGPTDTSHTNSDYADKKHLAHIMLRHLADDACYVLVDSGSSDDVEVDMVAVYKNNLIGRVAEVLPGYSKIVLVADSSCKVAAVCANTGIEGIHEGSNTVQQSSLNHVSHLMQPQQGDLVLSSGQGLVFPRGFALGVIEHLELDGMQYAITVKPCVDVRAVDYCMLVKKDSLHGAANPPKGELS